MSNLIIVDTNILVSALLSPYGNPAIIIRMVLSNTLQIVLDHRVYSEYSIVLSRPKFPFHPDQIGEILAFLKSEGLWIIPKPSFMTIPDRLYPTFCV